ncbi:MAG: TIGR00730 family Rossman fold protein [Actinomycetota bacterium]
MICVFAGSARRVAARDLDLGARLGRVLAASGAPIVDGGGSTGCMGAVADAALAAGGHVVGVVPRGLFHREEVHPDIDLVEVDSLHQRKQVMLEMADAFVALPGGLGTLDEVGEVLTWAQLGIHAKPLVFVDPDGYWDGVLRWIDAAIDQGYVATPSRGFFAVVASADAVLPAIEAYSPPAAERGPLTREQT